LAFLRDAVSSRARTFEITDRADAGTGVLAAGAAVRKAAGEQLRGESQLNMLMNILMNCTTKIGAVKMSLTALMIRLTMPSVPVTADADGAALESNVDADDATESAMKGLTRASS